jgi:hypothetical protein
MHTSSTILGSIIGTIIHAKKIHTIKMMGIIICAKKTIISYLVDPKTSSPLKCARQFMKDDLYV